MIRLISALHFILILSSLCRTSSINEELQPPRNVTVKSVTENSFTLSWRSPPVTSSRRLVAYSLTYTPFEKVDSGMDKELRLSPASTLKRINELRPGTKYAVTLSSIYEGQYEVHAPKFAVRTKHHVAELPVQDDVYKVENQECNCSETGTISCVRNSLSSNCSCHEGYTGKFCELCTPGYFFIDKECKPCPCSKQTSNGECSRDPDGQIRCTTCLAGHRGLDCNSCAAGYKHNGNYCEPFHCYSYIHCAKNRDAPGCKDCSFPEDNVNNRLLPTAHKSNSGRTIADGTVPLIAVIVTLGILVLVASIATCYRYWTIRRNRPRLPFWSIELQNENPTDCIYQHLDTSTNKIIETPTSTLEAGKLYSPSSPRTYNAINI